MSEKMCGKSSGEQSFAMMIARRYKTLFYLSAITGTVVTAFLFGVILYLLK